MSSHRLVAALACLATLSCSRFGHHARARRAASGPPLVAAGVHAVEELTGPELASLPRERTLFLLPVGMVEEHGPHLPAGSDNFQLAAELAAVEAGLRDQLPSWYVVIMPTVPYGVGGANELSGDPIHPGTYALQRDTLHAVVRDLGEEIASNGFRWTFVMYTHGAPDQAKAISSACDDVSDELGVTMANLTATMWADPDRVREVEALVARELSPDVHVAADFHAGAIETSMMLAAAPERVRPVYKQLAPQVAGSFSALRSLAKRPEWPGYFGSPALARVEFGRAKQAANVAADLRLIRAALDGDDLRHRPRDH